MTGRRSLPGRLWLLLSSGGGGVAGDGGWLWLWLLLLMMMISLDGVGEGIVLGGGRKAAAHRYGAHIGTEACVGDERYSTVGLGVVSEERVTARVPDAAAARSCQPGESQACGLLPNLKFCGGLSLGFSLSACRCHMFASSIIITRSIQQLAFWISAHVQLLLENSQSAPPFPQAHHPRFHNQQPLVVAASNSRFTRSHVYSLG